MFGNIDSASQLSITVFALQLQVFGQQVVEADKYVG